MSCSRKEFIKVAEAFINNPCFVIAYGAVAKLYEKRCCKNTLKNEVLSMLFDLCSNSYNVRRTTKEIGEDENDITFPRCCTLRALLSCVSCKALYHKPIVLYCGHSFCRQCVDTEDSVCHICSLVTQRTDVRECLLLSKLLTCLFPNQAAIYGRIDRARSLLHEGRVQEADQIYDQLMNENSCNYVCLTAYAEARIIMNKSELALTLVDQALQLQPSWPRLYYIKGVLLSKFHRYHEALDYLFKGFAMYPRCDRIREEIRHLVADVITPEDTLRYSKVAEYFVDKLECLNTVFKNLPAELRSFLPTSSLLLPLCDSSPNKVLRSFLSPVASTGFNVETNPSSSKAIPVHGDTCLLRSAGNHCASSTSNFEDLREDFRCCLCLRIFLHPATPPCGHTFCRSCLDDCLDYNRQCPLCKQCLSDYFSTTDRGNNICVDNLVRFIFPCEAAERLSTFKKETEINCLIGIDPQYELPVMLCRPALPGIRCPLEVSEPRHRGMFRRAMNGGSRRLGIFSNGTASFGLAEIGTIVQLKNTEYLPDGRLLIDTCGVARIRLLSAQLRQGNISIMFQFFSDIPVIESKRTEVEENYRSVHNLAAMWLAKLPCEKRASLLPFFGGLPSLRAPSPEPDEYTPPLWVWWLIAVLPLDDACKQCFLSMRDPEQRLLRLKFVLDRLASGQPINYCGSRPT